MSERDNESTDAGEGLLEGPGAPPAKGGGQDVGDLETEFEADNSSSGSLGGFEEGDEGASPPPSGGGGR